MLPVEQVDAVVTVVPEQKQITLPKLHACLRDLAPEVTVEPEVAARARLAIDRMLAIKP